MKYNDKTLEFNWIPERILETKHSVGNIVTDKKTYYSEQLPHTIDGLGIWGGFFFLSSPSEINRIEFMKSHKYIELHTNRGIKSFDLLIDPETINSSKACF